MLKYRLRKIGRKKTIFWSTTILLFLVSMVSIIRYYAAVSHPITAQNSGIVGNTAYVNDLDADYYYYESMNFVELTDRSQLPTTKTNTYGVGTGFTKRLVAVQLTYDGSGIANSNQVGYVDSTNINGSRQSKFVYYKYYPVVNNKIKIELIDNPYTMRPTNYAFNGWYCDTATASSVSCSDMNFSLDNDYYVRYLEVPVAAGVNSLTINLKASWIDARIATAYNSDAFSNTADGHLLTFGMHRISNTIDITQNTLRISYDYYDHNDQYISSAGVYKMYTAGNNEVIQGGAFVQTSTSGNQYTTRYYANNYTCNGDCTYFREAPHSDNPRNTDAQYTYSGTYYSIVSDTTTGNIRTVVFTTANANGDWHSYRIKRRTNVAVTNAMVPTGYNFQSISEYAADRNMVGYYYREDIGSNPSGQYVNANGENCSDSGVTCTNGNTYKRLTDYANDPHAKFSYVTITGSQMNIADDLVDPSEISISVPQYSLNDYYIMTTRDTNIIEPTGTVYLGSVTPNKPFTLTSNHDGAKVGTVDAYLGSSNTNTNRNSTFTAPVDMVIENIDLVMNAGVTIGSHSTSNGFNAGANNVKLGRNIYDGTNYSANTVLVLPNSPSTNVKCKVIVESGRYNALVGTKSSAGGSSATPHVILQGGSDFDRIRNINNNLIIEYEVASAYSGTYTTSSTTTTPAFETIVKSGTYGNRAVTSNNPEGIDSYYTYGFYVAGWGSSTTTRSRAFRTLKIEGGRTFSVNGGPLIDQASNVSIGIYMTGGVVDNIVGGAGVSETFGDRIVSITGGTVNVSVAGGSNSSMSNTGNSTAGAMSDDTLVYIGGNATIGNGTTDLYNGGGDSINGNVYGAGLGILNGSVEGVVNNSHVIINGGTINGDVFGGGNYGGTGTQTSSDTTTKVDILGGTMGNVYGGANKNGAGYGSPVLSSNYYVISYVQPGDTITRNTYYSALTGTQDFVSGNTVTRNTRSDVTCGGNNVTRCAIFTQVASGTPYIASARYYTITNNRANLQANPNHTNPTPHYNAITINMTGGHVTGSVYGGSNVIGNVIGSTTLNMSDGEVDGDVYGGGFGVDTSIYRNVEVNISGNITVHNDVYGGSSRGTVNQNGTNPTTKVNISGGYVRDVYGCGKGEAGQAYPYTYGQSTVTMTGGSARNVYGGNNISGTASYASQVYLNGGTVRENAYGGGNSVRHGDTNIQLNGATVIGDLFGGSNQSGDNVTTNVTILDGKVGNIFGGNNAGGSVNTTKVVVTGILSISGDVYGSGYEAGVTNSNVTIDNNVILQNATGQKRSVYGGGYSAAATTSKVLVKSGTMKEVYGGSNTNGIVNNSYVYISNGTITDVYGGNNAGGLTNTSHVYIGNGNITTVYGGGNAVATGTTNVYTYGGTMEQVFGGANAANVTNATNVYSYGGTADRIFGGSNNSGVVARTNVNIENGSNGPRCPAENVAAGLVGAQCYTIQTRNHPDVFGGNNAGGSSTETHVNIKGNAVLNDVFGGGDRAKVTGSTTVKLFSGTVENLYGGGNKSFVGDAVEKEDGAFDPTANNGNAGVSRVYVANGTVKGNVYGSGNQSFVYGNTYVYIGKKAYDVLNPEYAISNPKIELKGSVFGGSETNSDDSSSWDYSYKGVIGNTTIYVDGAGYNPNNITITGALFGSGNNSATKGIAKIYINNLGTMENVNKIAAIHRTDYVYLTDSVIELKGVRDRALPTKFVYGLARINAFYLLGSENGKGSVLHMSAGTEYLGQNWVGDVVIDDDHQGYFSGKMVVPNGYDDPSDLGYYNYDNFVKQRTTVSDAGVVSTANSTNNKLFMKTNIVFSVVDDTAPGTTYETDTARPVEGMTYLGMYNKGNNDEFLYGIYDYDLNTGDDITEAKQEISGLAYTYVYGEHSIFDLTSAPYAGVVTTQYDAQVKFNGFYSHYVDEDNQDEMIIKYVGATPNDANCPYYKWILGVEPLEIEVNLQATTGTVDGTKIVTISKDELKELVDGVKKDWQDTKISILDVDVQNFKAEQDVSSGWETYLVDKTQIPAVAEGTFMNAENVEITDANKYFALSMGTTTSGWMDNYKTNFYDPGQNPTPADNFCSADSIGSCVGSDLYLYDSTRNPRALTFWLYYSKNLDFSLYNGEIDEDFTEIPLGYVNVSTNFNNPHGDPTVAVTDVPITIKINISMVDNKVEKYAKAITAGKQYQMFDKNSTTITSNGAFSIYQMLTVNLKSEEQVAQNPDAFTIKKLYPKAATVTENGVTTTYSAGYRYLKSDYKYPIGTKITMLDLKMNEEYYFEVDSTNYNNVRVVNGAYVYPLSEFKKMSTTTATNKYDNDMREEASTKYYSNVSGHGVAVEEFIFTVDFAKVQSGQVTGSHYLYMESSRDVTVDGSTIVKPIVVASGDPENEMSYTIKSDVTTSISSTAEFEDVDIDPTDNTTALVYKRDINELLVDTHLSSVDGNNNSVVVSPTMFDDYKLGAKITILEKDNNGNYNLVTNNLFGAVVKINDTEYYPQTDGSIRLRLAGRVADVLSTVKLDLSNSDLNFGDYILRIETFPSYDGLYYAGDIAVSSTDVKFRLLNSEYGIDVTLPAIQVTHDVNTGKDKNDSLEMNYTLRTINGMNNPNVKVHLERRTYNENYDTTYERVDITGIADSIVVNGGSNILNNYACYTGSTATSGDPCLIHSSSLSNQEEEQTFTVTMTLKEGPSDEDLANKVNAKWKSGTYRVVFDMYAGNTKIGTVYEYLIIRSLDLDEEVEGS